MTRIALTLPLILALGTPVAAFGTMTFTPDTWPTPSVPVSQDATVLSPQK